MNFSSRDPSLVLAHIGLVLTLMCQTPMIAVPCRDTLFLCIEHILPSTISSIGEDVEGHGSESGGEAEVLAVTMAMKRNSQVAAFKRKEKMDDDRGKNPKQPTWMKAAVTLLITLSCLLLSESVPGVSTIWAIAGSTVSLVLAFLLPSLAFISLWRGLGAQRELDAYVVGAHLLLALSVGMIVLCSMEVIRKYF